MELENTKIGFIYPISERELLEMKVGGYIGHVLVELQNGNRYRLAYMIQ
ncbi:hypothetical protein LX64_01440 [Chitinophaga skermanii]|uniref:Uncharacterized protein n=1 Tax=Chitinophaga skermanii TaxID=331697 RepID=A0A327QVU4_9BACT|nr:hypothetical protein LX64_01440 [Chitinophaga skermanii]